MNLIVDIGNTSIKVAQFKQGNFINIERFKDQRLFLEYSSSLSFNNAIISSVREETFTKKFRDKFKNALVLNHTTSLPISNLYHTPETLGNDRLANAVGAFNAFPNQNTLTIDVGTCIKFDFINTNNEYLGGSISPGLKMRFNALHTLTDNLPLIDDVEINQLIGNDTTSSIQVGVYQGIIAEISNMISQYERKYDNLNIILTGGDLSSFLDIELSQKNSIFADEFHTLKGLNTILNYNVQK
jgi:type III pantothenate kinase